MKLWSHRLKIKNAYSLKIWRLRGNEIVWAGRNARWTNIPVLQFFFILLSVIFDVQFRGILYLFVSFFLTRKKVKCILHWHQTCQLANKKYKKRWKILRSYRNFQTAKIKVMIMNRICFITDFELNNFSYIFLYIGGRAATRPTSRPRVTTRRPRATTRRPRATTKRPSTKPSICDLKFDSLFMNGITSISRFYDMYMALFVNFAFWAERIQNLKSVLQAKTFLDNFHWFKEIFNCYRWIYRFFFSL